MAEPADGTATEPARAESSRQVSRRGLVLKAPPDIRSSVGVAPHRTWIVLGCMALPGCRSALPIVLTLGAFELRALKTLQDQEFNPLILSLIDGATAQIEAQLSFLHSVGTRRDELIAADGGHTTGTVPTRRGVQHRADAGRAQRSARWRWGGPSPTFGQRGPAEF
jgi:hypothetical protein